jgi:hypothetical protein
LWITRRVGIVAWCGIRRDWVGILLEEIITSKSLSPISMTNWRSRSSYLTKKWLYDPKQEWWVPRDLEAPFASKSSLRPLPKLGSDNTTHLSFPNHPNSQ